MSQGSPKQEIIYAFIDSQNLNLGIRNQGWKLDFKKFRIYLSAKYRVSKALLFIGHVKGNEDLYNFLKNSGYDIVFKPTIGYKSNGKIETKGNVDAELVLHSAAIEFDNYNRAVIVSGDGDFHCLVEFLIKKDKLSTIIIPNQKKYSALLRKFRPYNNFLNKLKSKLKFDKAK